MAGTEDKLTHVLLSTAPDDISLYNKPMARNCQIWDHELQASTGRTAGEAGRFAARDRPACGRRAVRLSHALSGHAQSGRHEVYWHRPLVAFAGRKDEATCCLTHRWDI